MDKYKNSKGLTAHSDKVIVEPGNIEKPNENHDVKGESKTKMEENQHEQQVLYEKLLNLIDFRKF